MNFRHFRKSARKISLLLLACLLCVTAPSSSGAQDKIVIGILPEMNVFKQMQRFKPLFDYLTAKVGVKVEPTILSRYGNIIDSIKKQEIHGAFFGSFTGALAITQLGVEPLARPVNLDGTSTYHGYIFVRKDSGIKTIADMKGKTLALVERATTAGYIFPLAWLKANGVKDIDSYFSDYYFAGSHDATVMDVYNGKVDVGSGKNTIYDRVIAENPKIGQELAILARSPLVPSNGLCVRPEVSNDLKKKLKDALLNLHKDPAGAEVLAIQGAIKFVETTKEDYQPVIDLAKEAGIVLKDYQYSNK